MELANTTWQAGGTTDFAMLECLPPELQSIISLSGGFILHHGAIHFRGCTANPEWNSLRRACLGKDSLRNLYPAIAVGDIPFAQDQLGDQYLLRSGKVLRLEAETGDVTAFAESLMEFVEGVGNDIQEYLNVGLGHHLEPGQCLFAYPPFCMKEPEDGGVSLKPVSISGLTRFHAELARQISDTPDGGQIIISWEE